MALTRVSAATAWLIRSFPDAPKTVSAGSVHYLKLLGLVAGGWLMARGALTAEQKLASGDGNPAYLNGKLITARFFADQMLIQADMLASQFMSGANAIDALQDDWL